MSELITKKDFAPIEARFMEMARVHNQVNYESEVQYACMLLKNNDYLLSIARQNPESMQAAVLNVAGAGISLNPVEKHAYLVPRRVGKKQAVCLDVSYMGLCHLAIKTGSVLWVHAELVKQQDTFEVAQVGERPIHNFSPFKERGPVVGAYCVAKLYDGSYKVEVMDIEAIKTIMEASEAYKAYKNGKARQCPWVDYFDEMAKKTVIKRASKTWPKMDNRLDAAIAVMNEHEGINFNQQTEDKAFKYNPIDYEKRTAQVEQVKTLLGELTQGLQLGEKIVFMNKMTGFNTFEDVKIQDNEQLDKIIKKLLTEKTSRALEAPEEEIEEAQVVSEAEKEAVKEDRKNRMIEHNEQINGEPVEESELQKIAREARQNLNETEVSTIKKANEYRFTLEGK